MWPTESTLQNAHKFITKDIFKFRHPKLVLQDQFYINRHKDVLKSIFTLQFVFMLNMVVNMSEADFLC